MPVPRLSLQTVARRSGVHPDLIRRFVALGLVDAERDAAGHLVFDPTAPAVLARIQRLRSGLCLNYASIGLVLDLLDRISLLEAALRRAGVRSETPPWT
ncbi:MerR family transcriptional regulator [Streptomyces mexicanus]|uniref:MerR family transcriptional regulator n=1 Tax=Streptomyces mexicanus TaxID=178566 RepID=A0A7X1I4M8_9ACTN|nr:MerR family transcriptional regulator [Streptomyces mexicanus]